MLIDKKKGFAKKLRQQARSIARVKPVNSEVVSDRTQNNRRTRRAFERAAGSRSIWGQDTLDCEDVEHFEMREVLRCILHTIVFHRALGLVRPRDGDSEIFEITYVQCGDAEVEKKIEEKIDQFISWVEKYPNKKSQICLSFYEVKNKQATWFTNKVECLYWE